jgi:hypothetical protein
VQQNDKIFFRVETKSLRFFWQKLMRLSCWFGYCKDNKNFF